MVVSNDPFEGMTIEGEDVSFMLDTTSLKEGKDNSDDDDDDEEDDDDSPTFSKGEGGEGDDDDDSVDAYQFMYDSLSQLGYGEKKEKVTEEDFNKFLVEELPSKAVEMLIDSYSPLVKKSLIYAINKGEELTIDDFKTFLEGTNKIASIPTEFTDDAEARKFLRQMYIDSGAHSEEDVDTFLDVLEDKDKLLGTATNLAKQQEEKAKLELDKEIENSNKQAEERKENNKKFIAAVQAEIDSLKWSAEKKTEVIKNLAASEVSRKYASIEKSPKALVQLADLFSYYDFEKQEFDLTKLIVEKAATIDSKKKIEVLKDKQTRMRIRIPSNDTTSKSGGSAMDELKFT